MQSPLGSIFAEEIEKSARSRVLPREDSEDHTHLYPGRFLVLVVIFIFSLGLLLTKLFNLTVLQGSKYRKIALENRTRETKIAAPRGIIFDRNGKELVRNIPEFRLPNGEVFYENLPATAVAAARESIARDYIYKDATAHILGYVGEASEKEVKDKKLALGDLVGKMGVEQSYDDILRGKNGKELSEVDAKGEEVRVLGSQEATPGKSLNLSIDVSLQKIADEELKGKKGAVIAQNPKNGEILAFYSSPSFDPNKLVRSEDVSKTLSDPQNPFFNRSISGLYPPGSTFKIVLALAAIESAALSADTKYEDTGIINVGPFSFSNWYFTQYGRKEGFIDIVTAIKRSNDIFFYKAGEATGIETIASWGRKVGLDSKLGIDIDGEAAGTMPDSEWKKKVKGDNWYLGDTYHVSIGQGYLAVTPLQVNQWSNVIAAAGKLCKPNLVKDAKSSCRDIGIKKETLKLVREGMREACSTGGTGWPLFNFAVPAGTVSGQMNPKISVDGIDFTESPASTVSGKRMIGIATACKTGTAEFGDPQNRTHAWFTVFAPVVNPQISVTVLVEGGGEGSNVAAPIAKKILEKWFAP